MTYKQPPKAPPMSRLWVCIGHHARYNRRVRYSAPLLAFLITPALAQIIPTGTPAADILLSQAIAEHRVFLTCSTFDPATHQQITDNWQRDVTSAAAILTARQVPPEAIAAFTTAADPRALLPAPDTPFADVRQLCDSNPDWQQHYFRLDLIVLELKLPAAFE
jgi:hypothetical protein